MAHDDVEICYDELEVDGKLAWGVVIDGSLKWFPKSECDIDEEEKIVTVPHWLAFEEGLI